jgi:hypothetical protein
MKFKIKKNKLIIFLLVAVISGVFLFGAPAYATVSDSVAEVIGWILSIIINFIGALLMLLMWVLIQIAQYSSFSTAAPVIFGWVIVRDICNMFFILILLLIAFGIIFQMSNFSLKKSLPRLVLMAVLINFSRIICGWFIDFAQVIMLTFVNGFKDVGAGNLTEMLGITALMDVVPGGTAEVGFWSLVGTYFLALFYSIVALVTILSMVSVLAMRMIMLWVYVIMSPMAYFLKSFPQGEKYASQWWEAFFQNLIVGPVLAFFIWIAFASLGGTATMPSIGGVDATNPVSDIMGNNTAAGGDDSAAINAKLGNAPKVGLSSAGSPDNMIKFIISIGMLIGGLKIAQQVGGDAGKAAGKGMSNISALGALALTQGKKMAAGTGRLAARGALNTTAAVTGVAGGIKSMRAGKGYMEGAKSSNQVSRFAGGWAADMKTSAQKRRTTARQKVLESIGIGEKGAASGAVLAGTIKKSMNFGDKIKGAIDKGSNRRKEEKAVHSGEADKAKNDIKQATAQEAHGNLRITQATELEGHKKKYDDSEENVAKAEDAVKAAQEKLAEAKSAIPSTLIGADGDADRKKKADAIKTAENELTTKSKERNLAMATRDQDKNELEKSETKVSSKILEERTESHKKAQQETEAAEIRYGTDSKEHNNAKDKEENLRVQVDEIKATIELKTGGELAAKLSEQLKLEGTDEVLDGRTIIANRGVDLAGHEEKIKEIEEDEKKHDERSGWKKAAGVVAKWAAPVVNFGGPTMGANQRAMEKMASDSIDAKNWVKGLEEKNNIDECRSDDFCGATSMTSGQKKKMSGLSDSKVASSNLAKYFEDEYKRLTAVVASDNTKQSQMDNFIKVVNGASKGISGHLKGGNSLGELSVVKDKVNEIAVKYGDQKKIKKVEDQSVTYRNTGNRKRDEKFNGVGEYSESKTDMFNKNMKSEIEGGTGGRDIMKNEIGLDFRRIKEHVDKKKASGSETAFKGGDFEEGADGANLDEGQIKELQEILSDLAAKENNPKKKGDLNLTLANLENLLTGPKENANLSLINTSLKTATRPKGEVNKESAISMYHETTHKAGVKNEELAEGLAQEAVSQKLTGKDESGERHMVAVSKKAQKRFEEEKAVQIKNGIGEEEAEKKAVEIVMGEIKGENGEIANRVKDGDSTRVNNAKARKALQANPEYDKNLKNYQQASAAVSKLEMNGKRDSNEYKEVTAERDNAKKNINNLRTGNKEVPKVETPATIAETEAPKPKVKITQKERLVNSLEDNQKLYKESEEKVASLSGDKNSKAYKNAESIRDNAKKRVTEWRTEAGLKRGEDTDEGIKRLRGELEGPAVAQAVSKIEIPEIKAESITVQVQADVEKNYEESRAKLEEFWDKNKNKETGEISGFKNIDELADSRVKMGTSTVDRNGDVLENYRNAKAALNPQAENQSIASPVQSNWSPREGQFVSITDPKLENIPNGWTPASEGGEAWRITEVNGDRATVYRNFNKGSGDESQDRALLKTIPVSALQQVDNPKVAKTESQPAQTSTVKTEAPIVNNAGANISNVTNVSETTSTPTPATASGSIPAPSIPVMPNINVNVESSGLADKIFAKTEDIEKKVGVGVRASEKAAKHAARAAQGISDVKQTVVAEKALAMKRFKKTQANLENSGGVTNVNENITNITEGGQGGDSNNL